MTKVWFVHDNFAAISGAGTDSRKLKVSSLSGEANARRFAVSRPRSFRT